MKGLESTKAPSKKDNQSISTFRNLASLDLNSSDNSKLHASPVPQSKLSLDKFIHGFVKSMKQQELERSRKNPPLNFMTTFMQNIAQFVPRVTGLRILYENAVKLFTWETRKNSWGVFFIYVLVCLRPVWLVILPFVAMWFQKYLKEGSEIESGLSSPKERGVHHKKGARMLQSPHLIPSFEKDFMAAREISGKYVLNMQFIQNMMGTHVQIHKQNEKKWKQVKEENRHFWLTVKYLPSLLALYYAFSAQSLFLIFGCYVSLGNNPYARALIVNLSPLVVDKLNSHCNLSALVLKVRGMKTPKVSNDSRAITIRVFENQRWWAMLGWTDQTVSAERGSWIDETGKLEQPPISQQHPEPGYVWEEGSSWEVARNWCHPIQTGECGWVYYDNVWLSPSSKHQINHFTRRRLWTRKMVLE
ncbi:hypothetical protein DSO57_1014334 [Entomophthora muscae]|uniref:Uncharacterized protein n=1 Tax=Entomophthora muscae TaxID=34485 RepID=A0ACC2T5T4_9FUNG|nr:hypothetical protein DSO57_1014334 [Entomophthora muscae]